MCVPVGGACAPVLAGGRDNKMRMFVCACHERAFVLGIQNKTGNLEVDMEDIDSCIS